MANMRDKIPQKAIFIDFKMMDDEFEGETKRRYKFMHAST